MSVNPISLLHQTAMGAIAAAGFGVLFNVAYRLLPWCAASGAVALATQTACLGLGWSLEGASLAAALVVGIGAQLLRHADISQEVLGVVGCIPMVPGSFAAKAVLGLYAVTTGVASDPQMLNTAVRYTLRVIFTTGAIGTGLAIPGLLARARLRA